jgi:predicted MFS family arabinose efflux permease
MEVNTRYILLFVVIMGLNGICVAWTTGGNNQTANVIAAKLGWTAEETRRNNTLINVCSQVGKTLGAYFGGKIIPIGRKKVFLYGNVLSFLTCLMQ